MTLHHYFGGILLFHLLGDSYKGLLQGLFGTKPAWQPGRISLATQRVGKTQQNALTVC